MKTMATLPSRDVTWENLFTYSKCGLDSQQWEPLTPRTTYKPHLCPLECIQDCGARTGMTLSR